MTPSKENYLKIILRIKRTKKCVRAVDIALEMNVSKPSVSRAIHLLEQENYITIDHTRYISFTTYGLALAVKIEERYHVFYHFLLSLGAPEDVAALDAGRLEHAISNESFTLLQKRISD